MDFAQLNAARPSPGAFQAANPLIDTFMERRWPFCISATGEVSVPEKFLAPELRKQLLQYPRALLWDLSCDPVIPKDQRALKLGYRREFFHHQFFDISRNRRPSSIATFVPTELNEPTGPGVVTFADQRGDGEANEFVWSPILPITDRKSFDCDKTKIERALIAQRKHYNSNSEFEDAERYLNSGDVKAATRSAASAVDAIIRYYRDTWGVPNPKRSLPYNDKIDFILTQAGRPKYSSIDEQGAIDLLHLYKSRSSMHEGDCYYKDLEGNRVYVTKVEQVEPWIATVVRFIVWIDSLA